VQSVAALGARGIAVSSNPLVAATCNGPRHCPPDPGRHCSQQDPAGRQRRL